MTTADHRLEKHSVAIAGHRTSVTLEAAFWRALKSIAKERGRSLSELIAEIDRRARRHGPAAEPLQRAARLRAVPHAHRRGMSEAPSLGTYDYIIVGGGTRRLPAGQPPVAPIPTSRVLLLEAGGKDDYLWIHIPVGYLYCMGNPRTDWCFKTEAEPGLGGRAINYPRGKVLGGCSSINGMIYMRGQARDYDQWRQLGNQGWGWDDVLPFSGSTRTIVHGADELHGAGGEWRIERQRLHWPILDAIRDAAVDSRHAARRPTSTAATITASPISTSTQRGGIRVNTAKAFLKPVRNRRNLRVVSARAGEARADRERPRRRRGSCASTARDQVATARGEVILGAGAIGSPHLLELSGIGQAERLRDLGIDVVHALAGVGENLQDHLQLRLIYKVRNALTLNTLRREPVGQGEDRPRIPAAAERPDVDGAEPAGRLRQVGPEPGDARPRISHPAVVARPLRRAAASLPRRHR